TPTSPPTRRASDLSASAPHDRQTPSLGWASTARGRFRAPGMNGGADLTITTRNLDFREARRAKKDEFYTSLRDIELELQHYTDHFAGKVVYCNCDDPRASNFFRYFATNFERLGLKKVIATCYRSQDPGQFGPGDSDQAVYLEYTGDRNGNRVPDPEEIGIQPL